MSKIEHLSKRLKNMPIGWGGDPVPGRRPIINKINELVDAVNRLAKDEVAESDSCTWSQPYADQLFYPGCSAGTSGFAQIYDDECPYCGKPIEEK